MRTIKIYCKVCECDLTPELTEISESNLWENHLEIMNENNFCILVSKLNTRSVIVAINNYNLKDHPDTSRFYGCCGSDGSNGLNKLCVNGHEVATEFSDCKTDEHIQFDNKKVIFKEKLANHICQVFEL
jgi:hypothetical protein